jgi:ribosome-binding protein aMBF1 (putative translation factor)
MTSEVMAAARYTGSLIFVQSVSPRRTPSTETSSFGRLLRRHRTTRGYSQERLALEAESSTRHLSCLETGRAAGA